MKYAAVFLLGALIAMSATFAWYRHDRADFNEKVRDICVESDGQYLVGEEGYATCLLG